MLVLDHVSRHFGQKAAVDDVTLTVERGAFVGVIGRSGAHRSTFSCGNESARFARQWLAPAALTTTGRRTATIRSPCGFSGCWGQLRL
jgi:ABC-type ATPase involved in cell division